MELKKKNIILVGNPNCGKSSIFNLLTGLKQKISNLPGTTIEQKKGTFKGPLNTYEITDLPGIYSINRKETEEGVVRNKLLELNKNDANIIVFVVDESNLRRNLLLVHQVVQLGHKCCLLLNFSDVAKRRNNQIDKEKLSRELGIPVLRVNAKKGEGFENFESIILKSQECKWAVQENLSIEKKYLQIEELITKVRKKSIQDSLSKKSLTKLLDTATTHKIWGFVILFFVLLVVFQIVFTVAAYPADWIESGFGMLSSWVQNSFHNNALNSLISNGLIPGLAGVMVFIPQIALLFLLIGILEDSGYLTRVSYISDFPMRKLGLTGKSVIPLLGGFACAIPGIMSTRTIANRYERLLTMFILPLMACSARLPVYVLIIGLCIPNITYFGFIGSQSLVMTALYMSGIVMASMVAFIARRFIKNRNKSDFILELPTYQIPQLKNLWNTVYFKCKSFVLEAGKIILIVSLILWFLASYGPQAKMTYAQNQAKKEATFLKLNAMKTKSLIDKYKLENSYAGHLGKFIEPAIAPLGFDWKTGIGIISSFAAREVFVGTMGTIFNLEDKEDNESLRLKMSQSTNEVTASGKYGFAYGISLLLFYAFAMQCASTVSVMYKESKSLKLTMLQLFGYSAIAYLAALIAYQVLA